MERLKTLGASVLLALTLAAPVYADECDVTWSSVGEDFEAVLEAPFHMDKEAAYLTLGVTRGHRRFHYLVGRRHRQHGAAAPGFVSIPGPARTLALGVVVR